MTISDYIHKIYEDGELTDMSTIRKFRIVKNEWDREVLMDFFHYNF